MSIKLAGVLILILGLAVVGYGLWYQSRHPPRVVRTGSVTIVHAASGQTLQLETRTVEIGAIMREEVRLPNGTWIDCAGDCKDAVRRQYLEPFEDMRQRGN